MRSLSSRPLFLVQLGILLSFLIMPAMIWGWEAVDHAREVEEESLRVQRRLLRLTVTEGQATQLTLRAASSGAMELHPRYREVVREIGATIGDLRRTLPTASADSALDRATTAARRMRSAEALVFQRVGQGRPREALALLEAREYGRQKSALAAGVQDITKEVEEHAKVQHDYLTRRVVTVVALISIALLGLLGLWWTILTLLRRHLAERARLEEALRSSRDELSALLRSMTDVIFVLDADGRYVSVTETGAPLLYVFPRELVGRTMHEVLPKSAADDFLEHIRKTLDTGQTQHLVYSLPIGDREVCFSGAASPMSQDRVIWVARDITALRETHDQEQRILRAEAAGAATEVARAQTTAILESITDAFLALDRDCRFTYVNRRAESILGRPRDQLMGRRLREEFPHLSDADFMRPIWEAITDQAPIQLEACYAPWQRWYDVRAYPSSEGTSIYFRDITERKRTEEELERSTVVLKGVLAASPDIVELLDTKGRFRWVSPSVQEGLGYTSDDLVGTEMSDLLDPDGREAFERAFGEVVDGRSEEIRLRYRARRHDGEWVVLESRGRRVQEGADSGIVLIARDVTRDHEMEERLRESEEVYRQLFDGNPFPMWTVDPETLAFLDANRAASDRYGYSREEFRGLTLRDIRPPEDIPMMMAAGSVRDEGDRFSARNPLRHRTRDGTLLDVEVHSHTLVVQGQKIFVTVANDVTERRRAEAAAEESHQLVSSIVEGTPDAIFVKDLEGRYQLVNSATARMLGRPAEEIIGADDLALFPREVALAFREEDLRVARGAEMISHEETVPTRDGLRTFTTTKLPRHGPNGAILGIIGISRDITKRKEAEEGLRAAKEEAERANRAKSEFLSRMSHELRTPMNAILGFAQILEIDVVRDDDQESVAQILRAGRHLLSLMDEVLDLSKIEADRLELTLEPVSLAELSTRMLELVRSLAAQQEVTIEVAPTVQERAVRADGQRLGQVLLNLLSNGIKYNRAGGTVWIACTDAPEQRLRIEVTDTGRGIPPEKLERLFTPFDRLDIETEGIPGTGLGLSLSKRLVTAMGGELGVYSVPGRGSTFWVELPRVDASFMAVNAAERTGDHAMVASAERLVLLYIEDNLSNLRLVERILVARPEVTLIPAMQGRLGLDLAREHRPDLILLDINLPDMRGDEVLARLQIDPATREIPVVAVSADATQVQIQRMLDVGARAYLTKPLDVRHFLEVVSTTLEESRGQRSVGADRALSTGDV